MQMLKKIFNSDKKKYYLELDEAAESQPVQKVVDTAEKIGDVAKEKVADITQSQPVAKAVKTAEKALDKATDQVTDAVVTPEAKQPKDKSKAGKQSKAVAAKGKDKKQAAPPRTTAQNNGASSFEPPFWVAAMYNNSSSNGASQADSSGSQQTFAPDNLMPTVKKSRRRPGPSLNQFRDMAKKARTPRG